MFAIQLPTKVQYWQLLETRESVIEFLKGTRGTTPSEIYIESAFKNGGLYIIGPTKPVLFGQYVVKDGENFRIYSEEEFNKKYKKCQKP